mgnify:CR=1 FL=1
MRQKPFPPSNSGAELEAIENKWQQEIATCQIGNTLQGIVWLPDSDIPLFYTGDVETFGNLTVP